MSTADNKGKQCWGWFITVLVGEWWWQHYIQIEQDKWNGYFKRHLKITSEMMSRDCIFWCMSIYNTYNTFNMLEWELQNSCFLIHLAHPMHTCPQPSPTVTNHSKHKREHQQFSMPNKPLLVYSTLSFILFKARSPRDMGFSIMSPSFLHLLDEKLTESRNSFEALV